MAQTHYSVLLKEAINGLDIKETGIYVDCTLGRAGHSIEILKKLTTGKLYFFEQDQEAINESKILLSQYNNDKYDIINSNFINLQSELAIRKIITVDGILYDLGVSSPQLDQDYRGFSYRYNADLDMRMDQTQLLTAEMVINNYNEQELIKILFEYGEEQYAKVIIKAIIKARKEKRIKTTFELVAIIKKVLPQKILKKNKHPAKKTFQAIRIEVNKELFVLTESLKQAAKLLKKEGRLVVISFHSLEDKIVKKFFQMLTIDPDHEINKKLPIVKPYQSDYEIITKKAIIPTQKELTKNHRSKSAKLRILKRVN